MCRSLFFTLFVALFTGGLHGGLTMPLKFTRIQKNSRHEKSKIKGDNKRATNRLLRRLARLDPENAPTKPRHYDYSG